MNVFLKKLMKVKNSKNSSPNSDTLFPRHYTLTQMSSSDYIKIVHESEKYQEF